mgnify:CR=1 FL=1
MTRAGGAVLRERGPKSESRGGSRNDGSGDFERFHVTNPWQIIVG